MTVPPPLLESALDYAGTFPPARLPLAEALGNYARYRNGPDARLLGRFLVLAAKLEELAELSELGGAAADPPAGPPWPLSVILSTDPLPDLERISDFARRWEGRFRIASLEAPPLEASLIGKVAGRVPPGPELYFETPLGADLEGRLAAISAAGVSAKVRTGGVTADAFPGATDLSRFLLAALRAGVPFKATAGLHHAFCGPRPLEDGPGSPPALMHGFLNLAVAASLLFTGKVGAAETLEILGESSPEAFRFRADGLEWRGRGIGLAEISEARRRFFRSFGTCSFEEPVAELRGPGVR